MKREAMIAHLVLQGWQPRGRALNLGVEHPITRRCLRWVGRLHDWVSSSPSIHGGDWVHIPSSELAEYIIYLQECP